MPDALIRSEYLVDWSAALVGSVWGDLVEVLDKKGCTAEFDRAADDVYTSWDIGIGDSTAIWFWRLRGDGLEFIDFFEAHGKPLDYYADEIEKRKWKVKKHWLPHDAKARTLVTGSSVIEQLIMRFGSAHVAMTPRLSLLDGVQAARWLLQKEGTRIHPACGVGLDAIRSYHYEFDEDTKAYSAKPEHDWSSHCFAAETEVITKDGPRQISELPPSGEVLTLCGWKPYRSPRIAKRSAPLVEVAFGDGYSVRCTPDHLFLTESGWTSAELLVPGTRIRSASTPGPSISGASCTGDGRHLNTSVPMDGSTDTHGWTPSGRSPPGATSTTETATPPTIDSTTWSAWTAQSTCEPRPTPGSLKALLDPLALSLGLGRQSGTEARPAGSGTDRTPTTPSPGQSGSVRTPLASTAVRPSESSSVSRERQESFAASLARPQPSGSATPVTVTSIARLREREDVWDITVPGVEHFALLNGAIVHNSADAFRYAAVVARQTGLTEKAARSVKGKPGYAPPTGGLSYSFTLEDLYAAKPKKTRRI